MPTSPPSSPGSNPTTPDPQANGPRADQPPAPSDVGWERTYYTVLALSFALLLPTSFITAACFGDGGYELFRDMKLNAPVPTVVLFYHRLGRWGTMGVGQAALLAILALASRRKKRHAVVIASILLVLAMLFLVGAIASGILPFRVLFESIGGY